VTVRLRTSDGRAIAFIERHARVLDRRYCNHSVEMDVIIGSSHLARLRENHPASQIVAPS
jgi:hypothetical protein